MKRVIEDFTCEVCGAFVKGNGRTNHCPVCLWSKHVDVTPGDRASDCGGMMKPVGVEVKRGEIDRVIHVCQKCGFHRPGPVTPEDDREKLIQISVADPREDQ